MFNCKSCFHVLILYNIRVLLCTFARTFIGFIVIFSMAEKKFKKLLHVTRLLVSLFKIFYENKCRYNNKNKIIK